jgi:2-C-methyl-D-erythritol 4-phosphate cytidylyltransferase/2-C-methyl-D-erythritol 2,4-cyclodiphosphate synthase
MSDCLVLIVAAGRGVRLGGAIPKQYLPVGGLPILRRTVLAFSRHPAIGGVAVVIHPDDHALYEQAVGGLAMLPPAHGGATRQESVRLGLESLAAYEPRRVLIHDAARPFVTEDMITRTIAAFEQSDGAIIAVPIRDTVKRAEQPGEGTIIEETLDRARLWRAQTPQGFGYDAIRAAHRSAAGLDLPDDAAVAERVGLRVVLVAGNEDNFKVTTSDDLQRAERLVRAGLDDIRTGQGFDVHQLGPGDHVWLCGVRIDHERSLIGHSDADVGLHALTDAILGAIGAGDIGSHFPPSEARWKGAASDQFLAHAGELVTQRGGVIAHVDVTLICERPKIGPHRAAMTARIAEILGLDPQRVSVKATTTEQLGFTGRSEGIASQAVATVRLPG